MEMKTRLRLDRLVEKQNNAMIIGTSIEARIVCSKVIIIAGCIAVAKPSRMAPVTSGGMDDILA